MAAMQRATDLLTYLVQGLVDEPDEVSVETFEEDGGVVVLELAVGPEDYGKVIGRGGRTAHALRTVIRAAAAGERSANGHQRRVVVDIVD
ncbi:MAG TPA: KH domain-containing protein [Solirubrobacteraceae bacterium]|nr:KH domain-containing protein [Solirubrobacteraceae bacterium]